MNETSACALDISYKTCILRLKTNLNLDNELDFWEWSVLVYVELLDFCSEWRPILSFQGRVSLK